MQTKDSYKRNKTRPRTPDQSHLSGWSCKGEETRNSSSPNNRPLIHLFFDGCYDTGQARSDSVKHTVTSMVPNGPGA